MKRGGRIVPTAPGSASAARGAPPGKLSRAGWFAVLLGVSFCTSLMIGLWAHYLPVARWAGGTCGEWAPPGWKDDPRCKQNLLPWKEGGYAVAKWSGAAFLVVLGWLAVRTVRREDEALRRAGDLPSTDQSATPTERSANCTHSSTNSGGAA
jgi:hypothetical protein